ncbi:MAG: hypothetical protein RLN89_07945 [Parvibaculum sp.]
MAFLPTTGRFIITLLVLVVLGSFASTHFVLSGLTNMGVEISAGDRLAMTLQDIVGIAPAYGAIFGLGLLVAFVAARFVTKLAPSQRKLVFLVAGGTAMAVTLTLFRLAFDGIMPISGARTAPGFIAQIAVGVICGYLFAHLTTPRSQTA